MPDNESVAIIDKANQSQTVSVFYTNCNDLRNKMAELMMVPETYGNNLKIMCVTETMFDSDMQTAEINIPNFVSFRKDRLSGKEGGGSCIYVHETIRASELESFNCSDSIAICVETDPYPFILVCVYRSQSLTHEKNQEIIEQINKIVIKENHELVVVGDWNLPDVSWDSGIVKCPIGTVNKSYILQKKFLDMFDYKNLTSLLDDSYITRESKTSKFFKSKTSKLTFIYSIETNYSVIPMHYIMIFYDKLVSKNQFIWIIELQNMEQIGVFKLESAQCTLAHA